MKIVMLGHSGVGKTTYMASLYGCLQKEHNRLKISTTYKTDHKELLRLYKYIRKRDYPSGTLYRKQYDFLLQYQGKTVLPFTWVDYRGGALTELSESPETQQLIQELKVADGIILFCDAAMTGERAKIRSQFGRMMNLVQRAIQDDNSSTVIVIVFTKLDLVGALDDDQIKLATNMMNMIQRSELHTGTIVHIACSGRSFLNVEIPALFVLYVKALFTYQSQLSTERSRDTLMSLYKILQERQIIFAMGGKLRATFGKQVPFAWHATYEMKRLMDNVMTLKRRGVFFRSWQKIPRILFR